MITLVIRAVVALSWVVVGSLSVYLFCKDRTKRRWLWAHTATVSFAAAIFRTTTLVYAVQGREIPFDTFLLIALILQLGFATILLQVVGLTFLVYYRGLVESDE